MQFHLYNESMRQITSSPWSKVSAYDLPDLTHELKYDNLVEETELPSKIFTATEANAGDMRAELMRGKISDLVVTLIVRFPKLPTALLVESVHYSRLEERIADLKLRFEGHSIVKMAFSEETSQIFYENDIKTGVTPKLPNYEYHPVKRIRRAV